MLQGDQRPELLAAINRGDRKIRDLIATSERACRPGETLVRAGEEHGSVYRLREGWAGRVREMPDGRSQYILTFLPGDLFAVKSMFIWRHPDAVETLSNAIVEQIDQTALRRAYESDPDVAMRCTWQVVEEERRLHGWVVSLGQGDVAERIAYLILQFRYRLALAGAIDRGALSFDVPMTQQQLADHLGLSLVHTNKALRKLRENGLIETRGRTYVILDWGRLAKLAEPLLDAWEADAAIVTGAINVNAGAGR